MKLTRVEGSERGKVDLSNWFLPGVDGLMDKFNALVKAAASEAIDISFDQEDWYLDMPAGYEDADLQDDPLIVHISSPLGRVGYDDILLSCNLRDLVSSIIHDQKRDGEKIYDDDGIAVAKRLSRAFMELSKMLDDSIAEGE